MGEEMKPTPSEFFLKSSQDFLREFYAKIDEAVKRLDDKQIWWRPNPASNSIGNLLLHLAGNVRQHIISGCGGKPDIRTRSKEFQLQFDEAQTPSKGMLMTNLEQTVSEACKVLADMSPYMLLEQREIQNKKVVIMQDIYHVVEHFSYHTGQIVMRTKEMTAEGFDWYQHLEGT